ncbi:Oxoglutarate and iron-dependent oxygenase degradation C-term-domain-containing protein [Pilobolus umbonatus]|nr:Oxoglutarate and iron-dependent oxygenase degradation C-term-domain-containing protein [Pilobolus umbonatus]
MSPSTINRPFDNDRAEGIKRMKIDHSDSVIDQFYPGLFSQESRTTLRQLVESSTPYKHCKIFKLMNEDLLKRVHKEIYDKLNFTTKETDIYKVNQTGDLANLDGLGEEERSSLSALFELRNAIYSKEFRDFVSDVTGCGPLSSKKMDMSVNTYTAGCHLLNHDDVIGTRRVSFILYMPGDPADNYYWEPSYGGALELYPVIKPDTPANEPTVSVPPQWNQFAMFTVLPGYSFHSVEEVVVENKHRLSIQGWFHFPQEGEEGYVKDAEKSNSMSSLQQIEASSQEEEFKPFDTPTEPIEELSASELEYLSEWMNPVYLNKDSMSRISDKFLDDSVVQLKDILNEAAYRRVKAISNKADELDEFTEPKMPPHGKGVRGDWFAQGSPVSQRYLRLKDEINTEEETSVIYDQLRSFLKSDPFRHWLIVITQMTPIGYRGIVRRFRPGHDYTLATTNNHGKGLLDVTLCLATETKIVDVEKWESCEYGGYECYMTGHEDDDDPATYRSFDEDGALLTVPAGMNELSIVLRDEGVMRFIKYVSARAPGSRWDISYEYEVAE